MSETLTQAEILHRQYMKKRTPLTKPAHLLAMDYHQRCEEYDRTVCSKSRDGIAMPGSPRESVLVGKHALELTEVLVKDLASELGIELADASKRFKGALRRTSKDWSRTVFDVLPRFEGVSDAASDTEATVRG